MSSLAHSYSRFRRAMVKPAQRPQWPEPASLARLRLELKAPRLRQDHGIHHVSRVSVAPRSSRERGVRPSDGTRSTPVLPPCHPLRRAEEAAAGWRRLMRRMLCPAARAASTSARSSTSSSGRGPSRASRMTAPIRASRTSQWSPSPTRSRRRRSASRPAPPYLLGDRPARRADLHLGAARLLGRPRRADPQLLRGLEDCRPSRQRPGLRLGADPYRRDQRARPL